MPKSASYGRAPMGACPGDYGIYREHLESMHAPNLHYMHKLKVTDVATSKTAHIMNH